MALRISGSVGSYESGAKNLTADITTVQTLLTKIFQKTKNAAFDPKGVDGKISRTGSRSSTVAAITQFQSRQVGMSRPDSRIDVNGGTWKKMISVAGSAAAKPTPVQKPATGMITLTFRHGNKIPKFKKSNGTTSTMTGVYESTVTLSGGGLTGTFTGSIWPDDMTVKGRVLDGTYPLHIGFHKGGSAAKQTAANLVAKYSGIRAGLLVNARSSITVQSDNPSKTSSSGINVHNGQVNSRGSDGCLTIKKDQWFKFVQKILDAYPDINDWHKLYKNTGKKIGTVVIKP